MKELILYREGLLARFENIVSDLRSAAAAIPPESLHAVQAFTGLTPHQTLAHLRGIEQHALAPRMRGIFDQSISVMELFDDSAWMSASYRIEEPVMAILAEYAALRAEELCWIRDMPPNGWSLTARHPWFGVRTFQWWVEKALAYAEEHLRGISIERRE